MTDDAISERGDYFTNLMNVDDTTGTMNGTFDNVDSGTPSTRRGDDDAVQ